MSPSQDADPHDLSLPDIDSSLNLNSGPVIDSSDEFPLPNFSLDEGGISPDILFPIEEEKTAEELPAATAAKPAIPDISAPSLDADHFEAGLDDLDSADLSAAADAAMAQMRAKAQAAQAPPKPAQAPPKPAQASPKPVQAPPKPIQAPPKPAQAPPKSVQAPPRPPVPPPAPQAVVPPPMPTTPAPPVASKAAPPPDLSKVVAQASAATKVPDLSKQVKKNDLTPPGAPATTLDEIFFDDKKPEPKKEKPQPAAKQAPPSAPSKKQKPVTRAEWAVEEVPVDQFVRQVKVKRKGSKKAKVRLWVPAAGAVLVAAAFFGSTPLFAGLSDVEVSSAALVVGSQPQGELYQDGTSLGATPVSLTASQVAAGALEIRKPGFKPVIVAVPESEGDKVGKFYESLVAAPVALSWDGLPDGSKLWWNGAKADPSKLQEVEPGSYSLKVLAPGRPAVNVAVSVEAGSGPFSLSEGVDAAFAKQPQMEVGLTLPEKVKSASLTVKVKGLNKEAPFNSTLKVSEGKSGTVVLPGPGKYKVLFGGDTKFKEVNQTVDLAEGATESVSLALVKQPPKAVQQPTSRPTYRPSRPTYRPSRPYRPYRPPSGGGGRIAPPSF